MVVSTTTLNDIPLFEDLDEGALQTISSMMHLVKVEEGEVLAQRGEPAHSFYVILSGNYLVSFAGGRSFTLHEKGQIVGWSSIVTPFKYTATAVALTHGQALSMSSEDFRQLLQEDPRISEKLMLKISAIISQRMPFVTGTKSSLGL